MNSCFRGAFALSAVCTGIAALITWIVNPWFLDEPGSFLLLVVVPCLIVGGLLGSRARIFGRPMWWCLVASALFLAAVYRPEPNSVGTQLLVVGIDGASWPVVERVETPNLDALVARGSWGTLIGEEPLFSPLLWSTMATGRRPDSHGIQGVRTRTDQSQVARFWEVARDAGVSVGLYKWLVTWPPPSGELPGFTVPAWLAGDAQTHPPSLAWIKEVELSRRTKRKKIAATRPMAALVVDALLGGVRWSTIRTALQVLGSDAMGVITPVERERRLRHLRLRLDRDCFVMQLHQHDPDLATFTVYLTDAISHTHWSMRDGQYVDEAYRLTDDVLGDLLAQLNSEARILVISDHGFRDAGAGHATHAAVPRIDALKAWLEPLIGGLQIVRVGRQLVLTPDESVSEEQLQVAVSRLRFAGGELMYAVDALPHGSAWSMKLQYLPASTDWAGVRVGGIPLLDLVRPGPPESGEHDARGIVVLTGLEGKQRVWDEVDQVDIAPTILALLGLPVASNMEGRALVAERVPRVSTHDHLAPKKTSSMGAMNDERLRALGYID